MHWSKVIIASLASSPSFAQQQQRLGGPELVDHGVEMVSEGKIFDDASEGGWEAGSRNFEVDQQDGADASDEQDIEKNVEDAAVFEPESVSSSLFADMPSSCSRGGSFQCCCLVHYVHMMCSSHFYVFHVHN